MLTTPMDILKAFPVRKTMIQKQAFRDAVAAYVRSFGYTVSLEHGSVILGELKQARYLVTASYSGNDSGVLTLLELVATLRPQERKNIAFAFLDRSGGAVYRKFIHKPFLLHLDDIGRGDHMLLIPTKKLKADRRKLTSFYKACGYFGRKSILVDEKAKLPFLSWMKWIPYCVCIRTRENKQAESACGLDLTNINLLRAALATFLTQKEA